MPARRIGWRILRSLVRGVLRGPVGLEEVVVVDMVGGWRWLFLGRLLEMFKDTGLSFHKKSIPVPRMLSAIALLTWGHEETRIIAEKKLKLG